MSEGAPKWTQWWQDDLPCQFTKEQAVENAAFLMRVLGKEVFVNTRFDGWRNHPLLVRWQSAGAGSFLELNVLADDIRQVEQVEGLDRCLSDLRDRNRFFSSRHTLHSAALFARSGKATVHSFLHDDAPDFLLECDNQMISVEAKLLERSDREELFHRHANELRAAGKTLLATHGVSVSVCVVVKDVESLPEKSDVMKAVELCLGKWEPGARVKGAAKQFNVWLSDPLVIPPPSGFHRTWTLLCPRSPHEVFRIKRRAQDASRQVRKFGASKNIHGFLVLGTTDEFVVRPAMEYIARDARRFRDLAAVMIDLPGTWLGKPQRRYIDYLGIWKNPASAKRLTSKLGVKAVGAAGHIQRDMVEPDGIPCYRVMSSEGRHVNRVHLPDIRWIKPEDLD